MPPPLPRTESSNSLRGTRVQRPLLPKIDPSLGFRGPTYQGELTPASSGPNSLNSPVSASSGPRSPWPNVRKGSIPGPRRPPSPELTNLDCAFPPFPLPGRAPTTRKRDRATTQRSDGKRPRSRDGTKGTAQSSRRPPLTREGSSNTPSIKSTDALPTMKQSRPTSPLSNEVKVDHGDNGTANLTDAQVPFTKSPAIVESRQVEPTLPDLSMPFQPTTILDTPSQAASDHTIDPVLSTFDFGGSTTSKPIPASLQAGLHDRVRAGTEPAYKSKRPPPIISNREIFPLAKSSTAPQPSPTGSIGRSLGRLFSRRRSQSATSRRDVVRHALSDEPESFDQNFAGKSVLLSPGSDRSFLTAEPSPLATSPLMSPEPLPSHEDSLNEFKEIAREQSVPAPPAVVVQPAAEPSKRSGQVLPASFNVMQPPETPETSEHTFDHEGSDMIEALRRVSIDSASSYGSIGFTERTTSSRSTAPQVDLTPSDPSARPESVLIKSNDIEVPAPLRPRLPQLPLESPTAPLLLQGRLSPIPDPGHHQQDSVDSLPSIHMERPASPEPEQETQPPAKARSLVPNKGPCRGCSKLILAGQKSVSSADGRLTGRYHKECFVCQACKTSFPTAEFYVHNDHPYCSHHYHELENSLCATCGKGIEGVYMETANVAGRGKEKHHPGCLKCTTCKIRLDHDYFELSGKVYCERDAFRLATMPRSHENAPSRPSPLIREYISSGDPGLVKGRNFPERRTTRLMTTN
ncbi:hypothetical protein H2200_013126 [Cladophialophora chaetospira]|uniref:LIM zinc-binding domain-containing protein n=1 Tax=Cladophialophora chaetospira TaxID=386627 RepID=A0AA39CBF8_9EURO|nr:hypothetical protein H2200_013126 [Cladophialophora chaetospira]